jgi:hypothetical protein
MATFVCAVVLFLAMVGYVAVREWKDRKSERKESTTRLYVCTQCGTTCKDAQKQEPGDGCIVILLLLCGIVPGLVFLAWSESCARFICPGCNLENTLIPQDTPGGLKALEKFYPKK